MALCILKHFNDATRRSEVKRNGCDIDIQLVKRSGVKDDDVAVAVAVML